MQQNKIEQREKIRRRRNRTLEFHWGFRGVLPRRKSMESHSWKLWSRQENVILLIINQLLWFTSINLIYKILIAYYDLNSNFPKLQSIQENVILLIINQLLGFTSISLIYRLI